LLIAKAFIEKTKEEYKPPVEIHFDFFCNLRGKKVKVYFNTRFVFVICVAQS
jgi:hypothetical protein